MSQSDQIRKKQLLSSPETVNGDWASPSVSLDDRTGPFSISVKYENGITPNMKAYVQLSNDDVSFGDITESELTIADADGTLIYDLEGSGAQYARIRISVTSGSVDVVQIKFVASQTH